MSKNDIGRLLSLLQRQSQIYQQRLLKPLGLQSSEFIYILHVGVHPEATQQEISDDLALDKAQTARSLQSLEKKGLITRKTSQTDTRAQKVSLTKAGQELRPKIMEIMMAWMNAITEGISEKEIAILYDNLNKMSKQALDLVKGEKNEKQ